MNNLNEAIKFIKDKLDILFETRVEHRADLEHILDLLIKTKQDFKNIQHKSYRIERGDEI